ncbi:MAG: beta-lactamase family protein [Gammaproteobacteria bacterium]|nr:beta-lactamase family protein [Gammaproteobacteria bacterium]
MCTEDACHLPSPTVPYVRPPRVRPYYKSILQIERKGKKINFFASEGARQYVYQEISRERPEAPAGERVLYSDLGFMLLGAAIEEVSGLSLDRYCRDKIFRPLGLKSTAFVDLGQLRIAPENVCPIDQSSGLPGIEPHAHQRQLAEVARDLRERVEALLVEDQDRFTDHSVVRAPSSAARHAGSARRVARVSTRPVTRRSVPSQPHHQQRAMPGSTRPNAHWPCRQPTGGAR